MPTYEYECTSCGHAFERFQGINEEPLRTCPECEGEVRRLISSGGGLVFKGSGFYATDYRRGSPPKESEGGESATKASGGDGSSGSSPAGPAADGKSRKSGTDGVD
ncbi:MAG: FmdB family zinc ribbon protein [Gemmatimonadota bacterium]|nr:FmdB family zinc ribbon protein [Gemmatimonadota bacterium]